MTTSLSLSHRLNYFMAVGLCATLVHLALVFISVHYFAIPPLLANVFAFLIAFNLSYVGHKHLTFAKLADQKQLRLPHFFLIASSAGVLNELLYYVLLRWVHLNYLFALVIVLGLVSVYSFILSKFWACR